MLRVIAMVLVIGTATARAEDAPEPLCLYGRARPACTAIALAEIGMRYGGSTEGSEHSIVFPMDLGILFNNGRSAYGATIGIFATDRVRSTDSADKNEITGYVIGSARYRKWLTDGIGLDVSLGGGKLGVVGEVGIEIHDLFAITAGVNTFQVDDDYGFAGNIGIRLGANVIGAVIDVFSRSSSNKQ